jgi:hypothetical protein
MGGAHTTVWSRQEVSSEISEEAPSTRLVLRVGALAEEVADSIVQHGLPFFDSLDGSATLLARLRDGERLPGLGDGLAPIVQAILEVAAGSPGEARRLLQGAYTAAEGAAFQDSVTIVAGRLGVPLG